MNFDWLPLLVALSPGLICTIWAIVSFDAIRKIAGFTSSSWADIPTVEALKELTLQSVFYAPIWIALIFKFGSDPHNEVWVKWVMVSLSIALGIVLFVLGRGCIAKLRQLEKLEELESRVNKEASM